MKRLLILLLLAVPMAPQNQPTLADCKAAASVDAPVFHPSATYTAGDETRLSTKLLNCTILQGISAAENAALRQKADRLDLDVERRYEQFMSRHPKILNQFNDEEEVRRAK